jgi:hypothetical protein
VDRAADIAWTACRGKLAGAFALLVPALSVALRGATNPAGEDAIPPLHPPRPVIQPGFWEEHGLAVSITSVLFLLLFAFVAWLILRPRPKPAVPAAVRARSELQALRQAPDQPQALSRASQVLRRYFAEMFGLPKEELTTTEFCALARGNEGIGPDLGGALSRLMSRCDQIKFAPGGPKSAPEVIEEASQLVDAAEARAAALRAPQPGAPANPT